MMRILRWTVVTIGSLVLTTLGINAFDNLDQPMNSMFGAAFSAVAPSGCPADMVFVGTSNGGFCIDTFEASPDASCSHVDPSSPQQTGENLRLKSCKPVSKQNASPWTFISRQEAELACARAGKRLPSNEEWYRAALGTPDGTTFGREDCNLDSPSSNKAEKTGSREQCATPLGAYDMVGNVWEWVQETARDGSVNGTQLPEAGYITGIDSAGLPIATDHNVPDASHFEDYLWVEPTDTRGILRGGFWKSMTDGGQYTMNVTVAPSFVGNAIGFRCVKDLPR